MSSEHRKQVFPRDRAPGTPGVGRRASPRRTVSIATGVQMGYAPSRSARTRGSEAQELAPHRRERPSRSWASRSSRTCRGSRRHRCQPVRPATGSTSLYGSVLGPAAPTSSIYTPGVSVAVLAASPAPSPANTILERCRGRRRRGGRRRRRRGRHATGPDCSSRPGVASSGSSPAATVDPARAASPVGRKG